MTKTYRRMFTSISISLLGAATLVANLALAAPQGKPHGTLAALLPPPNLIPPSSYLSNLYLWFLGFVGIAALFAIVRGGVTYIFSGANPGLVGEAKRWIWNGIWGIVLAAASYLLLFTINPDLLPGFDLNTVITNACIAAGITC